MPREYVTGETGASMLDYIKMYLAPRVLERSFGADWSPLDGLGDLAPVSGQTVMDSGRQWNLDKRSFENTITSSG